MEDNLNPRQMEDDEFFQKQKTTSKISKKEDDLENFKNGKRPEF